MNRRRFLQAAGAAAAVSLQATPARAGCRDSARPNILLLMADQWRGDCLGVAGNRVVRTPHLDDLAADGVYFRNAYSCTPTCTPARAALLTGLGPWCNGMLGLGQVGEHYPIEMPQAMRDAGYYTCGIGKMHWHPQRGAHGFHQMILDESGRVESPDFRSDYRAWFASEAPGLDPDATGIGWNDHRARPYALPEDLHPTHWTGSTAVNFLNTYAGPAPFFLKVSFARPHSPYDPPGRLFRRFANADLPLAFIGDWAARNRPRNTEKNELWRGDLGAEAVRTARAGYYGSMAFVDEQIGRILRALDKRRLLDDTLILFLADHGDMLGDHHLWRKSYAYEGSARIPMLLRWPKGYLDAKRGRTLTQPVEIRDVLPTFMEAANAPGRETLDGESLLTLARADTGGRATGGRASSRAGGFVGVSAREDARPPVDARPPALRWREWIDLEHDVCYDASNHWSGATDGRTKYIYHAQRGEEQLFDLTRDPGELHDLANAAEHADLLKQWRTRLAGHLAPRGEAWVRDGALVPRPKGIKFSPNYPGGGT